MSLWDQLGNMMGHQAPDQMRTPEQQAQVDEACQQLALYHFSTCPFCVRVRSAIKQLGLKIEERNIHHSDAYAQELQQGGGNTQVPCLRITGDDGAVQWMYESSDIINYLKQRFGTH